MKTVTPGRGRERGKGVKFFIKCNMDVLSLVKGTQSSLVIPIFDLKEN